MLMDVDTGWTMQRLPDKGQPEAFLTKCWSHRRGHIGGGPKKNIARLTKDGRIVLTRQGKPAYKRYLDEMRGTPISDDWADILPINSQAKERLGYSTQKPIALLQRIIEQSSNPGDVILDPFCGCGTAVHAAQNLNRQWISIDICVNACKIIEQRLRSHFDSLWSEVEFIGMPKTSADAKTLADLDKFRFERWGGCIG